MTQPNVSVIVPAYNTAPFIAETLQSVFAQTYTDYEVIVINDGSPDTPALEVALAPFRHRIHYIVQENRGLSAARNAGIAIAKGQYVALLDSDDVWEPDYLAHQLKVLRQEDFAVVYPNATNFGDPMRAGRKFMDAHPSSGPVTIESLVTQQCNVMVSVLARRDVLVAAGLFDESLRSSEDFDMWLRVVAGGWTIGYHRRSLVGSRLRRGSLSANGISMCQHIVRVLDKAARELPLTPAQRSLVAERRAYFTAMLRMNEGKRAFFAGDHKEALQALSDANAYLRRRKISLAIVLLRLMPGLLLRAYDMRDRVVFKTSTR
ncbi:MAG TPA: glycosyltransferase family A protein [Vicinamibacterales bacterium]|nr:glycosyltransferase family A protein [Vicinamibacterales bacterium]